MIGGALGSVIGGPRAITKYIQLGKKIQGARAGLEKKPLTALADYLQKNGKENGANIISKLPGNYNQLLTPWAYMYMKEGKDNLPIISEEIKNYSQGSK